MKNLWVAVMELAIVELRGIHSTFGRAAQKPDWLAEQSGFDLSRPLVSLKVLIEIDPGAVDRETPGQMRASMSWNRRAWIEADLKFEQSQEPAAS